MLTVTRGHAMRTGEPLARDSLLVVMASAERVALRPADRDLYAGSSSSSSISSAIEKRIDSKCSGRVLNA